MVRIALGVAAIVAAVASAIPAAAEPGRDVLCYTNPAFVRGHAADCKTAVNPLGDVPELPLG